MDCQNYTAKPKGSSHTTTHRAQKATIDQEINMLAMSKNIPFPGHNHLLTTGSDDLTLKRSQSDNLIQ